MLHKKNPADVAKMNHLALPIAVVSAAPARLHIAR
jgi:hypothetical protein